MTCVRYWRNTTNKQILAMHASSRRDKDNNTPDPGIISSQPATPRHGHPRKSASPFGINARARRGPEIAERRSQSRNELEALWPVSGNVVSTHRMPGSASKKRMRAITPSIAEEDYESAAAFLREFHAGRVAALHPRSTGPLSAIREAEQENELAADFSMALSVRGSPRPRSCGDADLSASKLSQHQSVSPYMRVVADVPPLRIDGYLKEPTPSSRMKKTSTTKCLVALDKCEDSADAEGRLRRSNKSTEGGNDDPCFECDDDFEFGYDKDDDAPASKRRCSM